MSGTINVLLGEYVEEVSKIYGEYLKSVILYGSYARGDFEKDSDIDIMVLLDIPQEEISKARKQISDISDQFDLDHDVVLAPVIQNYHMFQQYMPASKFYQNVQKEGVMLA